MEKKAKSFRLNSVADSTRRARDSHWRRYLKACSDCNWTPLPCGVSQACQYVSLLSEDLCYSSIVTYYQSIIFHHVCAGIEPVRLSDPILKTTLNGIRRTQSANEKGKDPIFPVHLRGISKHVDRDNGIELVVFVAALFLFRTLLRVSHVVSSDHTLLKSDVKFNAEGCLVRVLSSKTSVRGGEVRYIPITWASDSAICAVRGLLLLLRKFKGSLESPLFSMPGYQVLTYSVFSKIFKSLIIKAGLKGNFASHSLRRGGATHMSLSGCTVPEVKTRGGWKSECVYKYIRPAVRHNVGVDKKFSMNC